MKLEFKRPCLKDKEIIDKKFISSDDMNSDSAFGTFYIWADAYDIKICFYNNTFLKRIGDAYTFPKGIKNLEDLKEIIRFLKGDSLDFKLVGLLEHEVNKLEETFPGKFNFTMNRNACEYIYDISDLAKLSGKKYHSKRNHISKFNKLYNWNYFSKIDVDECLKFFKKWFELSKHEEDLSKINESIAIEKALKNFDGLGLCGGTIKVQDKIIACTIGEKINNNVLVVHFEKAFSEFEGAYSVINNEFCKEYENNFKLINREEDLGIPGLRKSKLSYKPKILLKRYNARWED